WTSVSWRRTRDKGPTSPSSSLRTETVHAGPTACVGWSRGPSERLAPSPNRRRHRGQSPLGADGGRRAPQRGQDLSATIVASLEPREPHLMTPAVMMRPSTEPLNEGPVPNPAYRLRPVSL